MKKGRRDIYKWPVEYDGDCRVASWIGWTDVCVCVCAHLFQPIAALFRLGLIILLPLARRIQGATHGADAGACKTKGSASTQAESRAILRATRHKHLARYIAYINQVAFPLLLR